MIFSKISRSMLTSLLQNDLMETEEAAPTKYAGQAYQFRDDETWTSPTKGFTPEPVEETAEDASDTSTEARSTTSVKFPSSRSILIL